MGNANRIWDTTSGGVSNIPTAKAPTIIYGRFCDRAAVVVMPVLVNRMVEMGTSKAKPKAKNILRIKSR